MKQMNMNVRSIWYGLTCEADTNSCKLKNYDRLSLNFSKKKDKKLMALIHLLSYNYFDLAIYDGTVFLVAIDNISNNNKR